MKKTLNIENQKIEFEFLTDANCWRTIVLIDGENIEIEIDLNYHKEETIDWSHFESFFLFINKPNRLTNYVSETKDLVLKLGKTIYRNNEEIKDWEAKFSNALFYKGKLDQNNFSFSLIFNFMHPSKEFGDDYGIYLSNFKSNILTGVSRNE